MSKFPFPLPHGWFGLCFSHELAPGDVKKTRFCGRDLALFRTETGKAAALDNYCPHLGAPLSQGCVKGEAIRCPFHHWQWNTDGSCKEIPYSENIPSRAVTNAIPVKELNGMVLGWHHADGREPYYDVALVDGLSGGEDHWGEFEYMTFDIPTCLQEIAENDVDQAHFPYLHGQPCMKETETEINGPIKSSVSEMVLSSEFFQGEVDSTEAFKISRQSSGPGLVNILGTGLQGMNGQIGEFMLYSVATPIEDEQTIMRWTMAVSKNLAGDDMGKTFIHAFATGIDDDMPIWAEKVYQPNPVLCDGDGPIAKHRKWFSQFYD